VNIPSQLKPPRLSPARCVHDRSTAEQRERQGLEVGIFAKEVRLRLLTTDQKAGSLNFSGRTE
jgi:hypothetical protein